MAMPLVWLDYPFPSFCGKDEEEKDIQLFFLEVPHMTVLVMKTFSDIGDVDNALFL